MSFSAEKISSDGGLLLLREIESRNGILQSITNCIQEDRHPGYVKHSISSVLRTANIEYLQEDLLRVGDFNEE